MSDIIVAYSASVGRSSTALLETRLRSDLRVVKQTLSFIGASPCRPPSLLRESHLAPGFGTEASFGLMPPISVGESPLAFIHLGGRPRRLP